MAPRLPEPASVFDVQLISMGLDFSPAQCNCPHLYARVGGRPFWCEADPAAEPPMRAVQQSVCRSTLASAFSPCSPLALRRRVFTAGSNELAQLTWLTTGLAGPLLRRTRDRWVLQSMYGKRRRNTICLPVRKNERVALSTRFRGRAVDHAL